MNVLVTGGAGFIGRWVVEKELSKGFDVYVLDSLSNGEEENLSEFKSGLAAFKVGDIRNRKLVSKFFNKNKFDICIHLAAQINVQRSLENPDETFEVNVMGTYNLLEEARKYGVKMVLVSTCMVYDTAHASKAIDETHHLNPRSPYAASKLASDIMAMSYYHAFGLPVVVTRPFNTYGPFQKRNTEGGVISIFLERHLASQTLEVFGDGTQTRDFIYVEDCADFIVRASLLDRAVGQVINAGSGCDIAIKDLALLITKDSNRIKYVTHHHPQSEIVKLLCDYSKAKKLLGWKPQTLLEEGIKKTMDWISNKVLHHTLD